MSEDILKLIENSDAVTSLLAKKGNFCVDDSTGIALLTAASYKRKKARYMLVCSSLYNAQAVANIIGPLVGEDNVIVFPSDDLLRCELVSSSKQFLAQRIYALTESIKKDNKIIIVHASSLMMPLVSVDEFNSRLLSIKVGQTYDINKIKEILIKDGYTNVSKIDQSLEFATRGDIIDIFPVNYSNPIRIEFFGDEVESIRYFDIPTQTSFDELNDVIISPATDTLFSDEELERFKQNVEKQLEKDKELLDEDSFERLEVITKNDVAKITNREFYSRTYKYFRYIKEKTSSIIDYFEPDYLIINNHPQVKSTFDFLLKESREYFASLFEEGRLLSHLEMYLPLEKVLSSRKLILTNPFVESSKDIKFETHPIVFTKNSLSNLEIIISSYLSTNDKLVIALANKQQIDTVSSLLKEQNINYKVSKDLSISDEKVTLTVFPLEQGFELPTYKICFISSKELFGYQSHASRFASRYKEAQIIKNYEELKEGDYVVHEQYGIGKFLDIQTIDVGGVHTDFLHIQYAGNNVIYIPLSQFRMVRKYASREGAVPKLSNPNGKEWEKTKTKIKERVNELADRLFKLYSERASVPGFAFQEDDELQAQFEANFPYELTDDQKKAVREIKDDMEKPTVMDRLLCGDVGFGKTEVAFRAAFKAISSGKQVAILCPTTLLARQHFQLAEERFRGFGIKIALISRLVPESEQKRAMKTIADGSTHLVIGTHRLLSKDFAFNDLGLLIVDEEQRFGVEQKEKIKELKSNIDVLSLSATPIPRTLQLSLIGVRPVSQIQTAPIDRVTTQTYVMPYSFDIAKELMERELSRKGQVFYVHNIVSSIYRTAEHISKAIPTANVGIVHGQMDKEEIDDVMERFYNGEIDILVATSIIENGIDIPNANLIIVEDADTFGLAQLYQIKGRVGRSSRIAYAYLFYKEAKTLNNAAARRLKAIQDFAELGSGYKIAQRDLMIRGAGDILGPEQAGFIDSVGLDLYLKLLNEVIEEKKTGKSVEPPKPVKMFNVDAYIPDGFASKEDKMQLYQEIDACKSESDLKNIKRKIRDIYGRIPEEVNLLLKSKLIDIYISGEEIDDVNEYPNNIEIVLSKKFSSINGMGANLFEVLEPYIEKITLSYLHKELRLRLKKEDNWMKDLEVILECITKLYKKHK